MIRICHGNNLDIVPSLGQFDLIYIDPPFNTGKKQTRTSIKTKKSKTGKRIGYKGDRYETTKIATRAYDDKFEDFESFIKPRMEMAKNALTQNGSLFFHIDHRESHYCKIWLDEIFGRESFMNEIIWAYDYGGRSKKKWSAKHDTIFWYTKDPDNYIFNYDEMERIPYMAPGLVGKEKTARGKTPTTVWWHTIVPTNGKEKTGYPTQKPLGVLKRIINVHTNPNSIVLDFFCGSGTTGQAAEMLGRDSYMVDANQEAINVMKNRFVNNDFCMFNVL